MLSPTLAPSIAHNLAVLTVLVKDIYEEGLFIEVLSL